MRTAIKAVAALVAGALLAGCAGATDGTSGTASVSSTTDSAASTGPGARIPDGTWSREVTTAEISRRGLTIAPEVIVGNYLDDGRARLVLKTQGSRWSILVEDNEGAFEVGDQGDTSYDAKGRWVQASDSSGGSGLIVWAVSGDTLTTSMARTTSGPQPADDDRLFLEGDWQRQG